MIVLGLHYGHDASVAVVKNGKLAAAVSSERVTRIKKHNAIPQAVIDYALAVAGIAAEDVDCVALADYDRDLADSQFEILDRAREGGEVMLNDHLLLQGRFRNRRLPVYVINHHLAHCASSFYTSNQHSAWCFSMDSSGHHVGCNSLIARGQGLKLQATHCPGLMVGYYYALFTDYVGMGNPVHKAGSLMGLASYAEPNSNLLDSMPELINHCYSDLKEHQDHYTHKGQQLWNMVTGTTHKWDRSKVNTPQAMKAAASIQLIFEESILHCLKTQIPNESRDNLCLSGGSFLNCSVNTRIRLESGFSSVHHFPACGDDGIAVGSALYVAHHILEEPRYNYSVQEICYLGMPSVLYQEPDYERIAELLSKGAIIGWFMGASEYGPRALGHRSILADPRDFHKRELLNFVVKNREWFRPFAPMVLEERSKEWFDFPGSSPYMLYTSKVLQPDKIPAVTHVDGTARQQTVSETSNPEIYNLIKAFENLTGVPVIVNTSLNGSDEPILETEQDALNFFNRIPVDAMVINGKLITRSV